jgi:hypothetical protein
MKAGTTNLSRFPCAVNTLPSEQFRSKLATGIRPNEDLDDPEKAWRIVIVTEKLCTRSPKKWRSDQLPTQISAAVRTSLTFIHELFLQFLRLPSTGPTAAASQGQPEGPSGVAASSCETGRCQFPSRETDKTNPRESCCISTKARAPPERRFRQFIFPSAANPRASKGQIPCGRKSCRSREGEFS